MLKISNLHAVLITLSLAGYPLTATISTALSYSGSGLAIAMRALVLLLSFVLLAPSIARMKRSHIKYAVIFAVFWFMYILRMSVDTSSDTDQLSKPASEYWIWAIGVCLVPALALLSVSPAKTMKKAFYMAWLALGASALLTLFFGSTVVAGFKGADQETGRLALNSLNPISAGHLGASLVILSGWYYFAISLRKTILNVASLAGIIAGTFLLISSASRGPFVALACVLLAILWTLKFRKLLKVMALITLVAIFLLPFALSVIDFDSLQLAVRIVGAASGDDLAVSSRQESYAGAWQQFIDNPLLGDFLDERTTGYYPHNLILEAFMATGISGGLSFLAISLIALFKSYRLIKAQSSYGWVGLIYIQLLVAGQFSGAIYSSSTFWAFAALIIFTTFADNPGTNKTQTTRAVYV